MVDGDEGAGVWMCGCNDGAVNQFSSLLNAAAAAAVM